MKKPFIKVTSFIVGFLLGLLVIHTVHAQTGSVGPLYVNGKNQQGYPIFMLRCWHQRCVGPHGKDMGSTKNVAQYMPEVQVVDIQKYGYNCWILCRDNQGNIIGKPSPDYRNPYTPL